jgi:hypothetical protein
MYYNVKPTLGRHTQNSLQQKYLIFDSYQDTISSTLNLKCAQLLRAYRQNFKMTFQQPEVGLLNKSSCLAAALGVTKFIIVKAMNSVTLCCAT